MKKYTFEQKLDYNRKRAESDSFARGYVAGATTYMNYSKFSVVAKEKIKRIISLEFSSAKKGVAGGKGFACGMRDAANERKNAKR